MQPLVMHISYSQISVFDGRLASPFNDWADVHVRQGFAWRPQAVSFETLIADGPMSVECRVLDRGELVAGCTRAISVPFTCSPDATVKMGTITQSQPVEISPGEYQLVIQTDMSAGRAWCKFDFVRGGDLSPSILVQDVELEPTDRLLIKAEPA